MQKFVFTDQNKQNHHKENSKKSIQSVTIYKGPVAKNYPISGQNKCAPVKKQKRKINKISSLKIDNKTNPKFYSSNKPNTKKTRLKDYKTFNLQKISTGNRMCSEINSALPGTTNLVMSQDFSAPLRTRGSYNTLTPPMSNSTRSSVVRTKLENQHSANTSTEMNSKPKTSSKTRNSKIKRFRHNSIQSLSTNRLPLEKTGKKTALQKRHRKQNRVVLMAQVDLEKETNGGFDTFR